MKTNFIKIMYLTFAFIFMGLGLIGVALPILPTTPFLLLASYFFAKGSERFHRWFIKTKLYRNHLEEFVKTRSMTLKKKLSILIPVSILLVTMAIIVNSNHAKIAISLVIVLKYYYFFFHIKTIEESIKKDNTKVAI